MQSRHDVPLWLPHYQGVWATPHRDTRTAILESSTTPLSSNPVTKCYYTNGARYDEDISQNTNDKGQVIWATS